LLLLSNYVSTRPEFRSSIKIKIKKKSCQFPCISFVAIEMASESIYIKSKIAVQLWWEVLRSRWRCSGSC
jgi:hypothetical protein